jgi:hypothetical protein
VQEKTGSHTAEPWCWEDPETVLPLPPLLRLLLLPLPPLLLLLLLLRSLLVGVGLDRK